MEHERQNMTWDKSYGVLPLCAIMGISLLLVGVFEKNADASTGKEVFRGFTSHISAQIRRDKQTFYEAQSCTSWFYEHLKPPADPPVKKTSFYPVSTPRDELDCGKRYPEGLEGLQAAREAFAQTQQSLSLSLTFYEFALVVDRDDDGQYNGGELNDLFESFGMPYEDRLPSDRYIVSLNGVFDSLRQSGELKTLVNSMEVLLEKGYRFTSADQAALNRELD